MEWISELKEYLNLENVEKIDELESRCCREIDKFKHKKYAVEKLKRDEFATKFLSNEIKHKILGDEGQKDHTVFAAM